MEGWIDAWIEALAAEDDGPVDMRITRNFADGGYNASLRGVAANGGTYPLFTGCAEMYEMAGHAPTMQGAIAALERLCETDMNRRTEEGA